MLCYAQSAQPIAAEFHPLRFFFLPSAEKTKNLLFISRWQVCPVYTND
jgi:hypothetical protein